MDQKKLPGTEFAEKIYFLPFLAVPVPVKNESKGLVQGFGPFTELALYT